MSPAVQLNVGVNEIPVASLAGLVNAGEVGATGMILKFHAVE